MILNDILIELRGIRIALEAQANISSFPVEMQTKQASIPSMSNSNIEEAQQYEEEVKYARHKIEKALANAEESGFFFAEDTISEEELERLI